MSKRYRIPTPPPGTFPKIMVDIADMRKLIPCSVGQNNIVSVTEYAQRAARGCNHPLSHLVESASHCSEQGKTAFNIPTYGWHYLAD